MPDINIQLVGLVEIAEKLEAGVEKPISAAVAKTANFLETTAKRTIRQVVYSQPKGWYNRTGKALQSIVANKKNPLTWEVKVGVMYGKYIEHGTGKYHTPDERQAFWTTFGGRLKKPIRYSGMRPRPFWFPSVSATRQQAPQILNAEIRKYTNNFGNV